MSEVFNLDFKFGGNAEFLVKLESLLQRIDARFDSFEDDVKELLRNEDPGEEGYLIEPPGCVHPLFRESDAVQVEVETVPPIYPVERTLQTDCGNRVGIGTAHFLIVHVEDEGCRVVGVVVTWTDGE